MMTFKRMPTEARLFLYPWRFQRPPRQPPQPAKSESELLIVEVVVGQGGEREGYGRYCAKYQRHGHEMEMRREDE